MTSSQDGTVSFLSFTHLGYPSDLKSIETYYTAYGLQNAGILNSTYVLDVADTGDLDPKEVHVPVPGGKTIPRALYLADRMFPTDIDARSHIIDLMDWFASRQLREADILYTLPQFHRTVDAQHAAGGKVAIYGSMAHPDTNSRLFREEVERWNYHNVRSPIPRKHAFNKSDYVLTLSEFAVNSYLENGFDCRNVYNIGPIGIDTRKYSPTDPPKNEFVVLYVANTTAMKGLGDLLNAWKRFDREDARLVLCGTMDDAVFDVHGDRINSMDDVEYVGYVDDPRDYYEHASMLVHPSISESFGKVILEAMASAIPVVVTEHGPREFVDNAGFVVPIRDSDSLADRFRYLYDNPEEASAMGSRGRELAENATWEAFGERVADAHKTILEQEGFDV